MKSAPDEGFLSAKTTPHPSRMRCAHSIHQAVLHSLKLKSPVIVFAGGKDDWTPAHVCEEAKARERTPGEELELIIYPNAHHAFDQKRHDKFLGHIMIYDKQATADSQKKMKEFFLRYQSDDLPSSAKSGSNQNRHIN